MNHYMMPGLVPDVSSKKRVDEIIQIVCDEYHITIEELKKQNRTKLRDYAHVRRMIFYFLRRYTNMPYSKIGLIFMKDHSTVIAGLNKLDDLTSVGYKEVLEAKINIENEISKRYKRVKR